MAWLSNILSIPARLALARARRLRQPSPDLPFRLNQPIAVIKPFVAHYWVFRKATYTVPVQLLVGDRLTFEGSSAWADLSLCFRGDVESFIRDRVASRDQEFLLEYHSASDTISVHVLPGHLSAMPIIEHLQPSC